MSDNGKGKAMLDVNDILSLEFYKKSPFYGSLKGIRYRIEKSEDKLKCTTWPEPYGYEATDDSLKEIFETDFSEEGLEAVAAHINSKVQ